MHLAIVGGATTLTAQYNPADSAIMPLSRFFERPAATSIKLTIEREGERHTFTSILKDVLPPTDLAQHGQ